MRLVRTVMISGNLTVTIPRSLCRELGLIAGLYVSIRRGPGRVVLLEEARLAHSDDRTVSADSARADR